MSSPYTPYPQGGGQGEYGQANYPQGGPQRGYLQGGPVDFGTAISEGLKNVTTFSGRASRSAFWWFVLGGAIVGFIVGIIAAVAKIPALIYVVDVIFALLSLSVAVRRLHDSGRSGFWWLIGLILIIGTIPLLVFYCLPGTPGENSYG